MKSRAAEYLWNVRVENSGSSKIGVVVATTMEKAVETAKAIWKRQRCFYDCSPCFAERGIRVGHFA